MHVGFTYFGHDNGRALEGNIPSITLPSMDILVASLGASPEETQATAQRIKDALQQQDAARVMLAALKLVRHDPAASSLSAATWHDIKAAIAAAEAVGIT